LPSDVSQAARSESRGGLKRRGAMQRRQVASAAMQAAAMGVLAAGLTVSFTNPLGLEWGTRDSLFVLAVVAAVFYNRIKSMRLEQAINTEHQKLLAHGK